jgi:hypothetical protein
LTSRKLTQLPADVRHRHSIAGNRGSASQSIQIAPFTSGYNWKNTSPDVEFNPDWTIQQNQWHGRCVFLCGSLITSVRGTDRLTHAHSVYQESLSSEVMTDNTSFSGRGYTTYGFEVRLGGSDAGQKSRLEDGE